MTWKDLEEADVWFAVGEASLPAGVDVEVEDLNS